MGVWEKSDALPVLGFVPSALPLTSDPGATRTRIQLEFNSQKRSLCIS
jgi:hypothetical protein